MYHEGYSCRAAAADYPDLEVLEEATGDAGFAKVCSTAAAMPLASEHLVDEQTVPAGL